MTETYEPIFADAFTTYVGARLNDPEMVTIGMANLITGGGWHAVGKAMVFWCDLYLDHATAGKPHRVDIKKVNFYSGDGTPIDEIDHSIPDVARWAVLLLRARAEKDLRAWIGASALLPKSVDEVYDYVIGLVMIIAATNNSLPGGWALMGVDAPASSISEVQE